MEHTISRIGSSSSTTRIRSAGMLLRNSPRFYPDSAETQSSVSLIVIRLPQFLEFLSALAHELQASIHGERWARHLGLLLVSRCQLRVSHYPASLLVLVANGGSGKTLHYLHCLLLRGFSGLQGFPQPSLRDSRLGSRIALTQDGPAIKSDWQTKCLLVAVIKARNRNKFEFQRFR